MSMMTYINHSQVSDQHQVRTLLDVLYISLFLFSKGQANTPETVQKLIVEFDKTLPSNAQQN
jgi:hypothetical protein